MGAAITIERGLAGSYLVKGAGKALRKRYWKRDRNKAFSRATGFAVRMAAELGVKLEDKTGRLSEADCAALVDAMREDMFGVNIGGYAIVEST